MPMAARCMNKKPYTLNCLIFLLAIITFSFVTLRWTNVQGLFVVTYSASPESRGILCLITNPISFPNLAFRSTTTALATAATSMLRLLLTFAHVGFSILFQYVN
jgi:hypothetical protein